MPGRPAPIIGTIISISFIGNTMSPFAAYSARHFTHAAPTEARCDKFQDDHTAVFDIAYFGAYFEYPFFRHCLRDYRTFSPLTSDAPD
jgi:hypothetical protein